MFSAGLLDVMCKSYFFNNQLWGSSDPVPSSQKQNIQTFLLQMWKLDYQYFQWGRCAERSKRAF
jgi:hypothetical protein